MTTHGSSNQQTFEPILRPEDLAAALAHRGCCGTEHDPANGKLHGYCVVCGVPWPCETARFFLRPSAVETYEPVATVHVFGVKRPIDSAPFFLAFTDQGQALRYPSRVTMVATVALPPTSSSKANDDEPIPMSIQTESGAKVTYAFPRNGYPGDQSLLERLGLTVGATYTVSHIDVNQSLSTLYLREYPGKGFNTVNFANAVNGGL